MEIYAFRGSLSGSNRSINHVMDRVAGYHDFAATQGVPSPYAALVRPVNLLRLRKGSRVRPIRLISMERLATYLSGFDKPRDRLMAALMYFCGLRLSEVVNLRRELLDISPADGHVCFPVRGKGRKVRHLAMSVELRDKVLQFAKTTTGPHIFSIDGRRISESTVQKAFARNRERTKIEVNCHLLRHHYASHRYQHLSRELQGGAGLNSALKVLQVELGHSHILTTGMYIHSMTAETNGRSLRDWQNEKLRGVVL